MFRLRYFGLLCLALALTSCAAKPPALPLLESKDFPVYAPSTVDSVMGAQSGDSLNDPKANHRMTYWLKTEDAPDKVVAFYKQKMSTLPDAKEVSDEEKFDGALLQFECNPSTAAAEKVERLLVIVEPPDEGETGTQFRVTETLKPGLKYPD